MTAEARIAPGLIALGPAAHNTAACNAASQPASHKPGGEIRGSDAADPDSRILILAPRGRDADVVGQVLGSVNLPSVRCQNIDSLRRRLEEGAGAAIVTEEALAAGDIDSIMEWLARQPLWSDFPFVILVTKRMGRRSAEDAERLRRMGSVVLLERPINAETLVSAAQSSMRSRLRQYQARDLIAERIEAEERLRLALEAGRFGAWDFALRTSRLTASNAFKANFGRGSDAPFSYADLKAAIHPEDWRNQRGVVAAAVAAGKDFDTEFRVIWPDGGVHWLYVRGGRISNADGKTARLSGVAIDITQRKLAEKQLRQLNESLETRIVERTAQLREANERLLGEIAARERAQAAFVQAQKMEAIGHLTGGIAHDFNNLLTAILGNFDLIARSSADSRIQRMAGYGREAVARAAKLTGQLLAFSRSQNLVVRPIEIDRLILGMDDLLSRSLGHTIDIRTELNAGRAAANTDANQVELAILNLAINARDAMPEGGRLTIATRIAQEWGEDLKPGRYIVISVSDTGTGIPPEVLGKVFDPFFTTKAIGRGTGLGLSQVYGIARQCGGAARIESELGKGAKIDIWLPLADEAAVDPVDGGRAAAAAHGSSEKILVIDDDPDVRRFIVQCLETLDYDVSQAEDGETGLAILKKDCPHLLVVDFAMPGLNGAAVAERARAHHPSLPVILVTGYADTHAVEKVLGGDWVLRKPFKVEELATTLRRALDSAETRA
jgi:PAS domain S-box-containing protein